MPLHTIQPTKILTPEELEASKYLFQTLLAKSEKTYEANNKLYVTFNNIEFEILPENFTNVGFLKGIMLAVIINTLGSDIFNIKQINSDINDNNMQ